MSGNRKQIFKTSVVETLSGISGRQEEIILVDVVSLDQVHVHVRGALGSVIYLDTERVELSQSQVVRSFSWSAQVEAKRLPTCGDSRVFRDEFYSAHREGKTMRNNPRNNVRIKTTKRCLKREILTKGNKGNVTNGRQGNLISDV